MKLRSRGQSWGILTLGVGALAYCVYLGVEALVEVDGTARARLAAAFAGVCGVMVFIPLWRAGRAHARVDGDRLTVVNTLRTTTVPADEIAEFRLGPKRLSVFYAAATAELRNGDELIIFGIQAAASSSSRSNAQGLVDKLNEWLSETRPSDAVRGVPSGG